MVCTTSSITALRLMLNVICILYICFTLQKYAFPSKQDPYLVKLFR